MTGSTVGRSSRYCTTGQGILDPESASSIGRCWMPYKSAHARGFRPLRRSKLASIDGSRSTAGREEADAIWHFLF
jgi:hypothetical protein